MTKELLILRHAKSDWKLAVDDFNRPLKQRGIRAAQSMGVWLQQQQLIPDYIVSSPAQRALMTSVTLCKAMGLDRALIHEDERLYGSTVTRLKTVLGELAGDARRVLLVGHNPELEALLADLADQPITMPVDGKLLPTASLARLSMPENWHILPTGCARLQTLIRPSNLPKGFSAE